MDKIDYKMLRCDIIEIASKLWGMRHVWLGGEVLANEMLAYRHLEDASSRLGRAIDHLDESVE